MSHNFSVINSYFLRKDYISDGRLYQHLYMFYMDDLDALDNMDFLEYQRQIYRGEKI